MRLPALTALLVALAGCGRAGDERAVSAVTARFVSAVASGDGKTACRQLAADTARALEENRPCDEAVTALEVLRGAVTRVQVFGTAARADVAGGDSYFLDLTPGGWRITAAGCARSPGDEPYECEVES